MRGVVSSVLAHHERNVFRMPFCGLHFTFCCGRFCCWQSARQPKLPQPTIPTAKSKSRAAIATPPKAGHRCGSIANSNTSKPDFRWRGNMRAWPASNAMLPSNSPALPRNAKRATKMCTTARSVKIVSAATRRKRGRMFQRFRRCIKPRASLCLGCINMSVAIIATRGRARRNSSICRCNAAPAIKKILTPPPIRIIARPDFPCAANNAITARSPAGKSQGSAVRVSITAKHVFL